MQFIAYLTQQIHYTIKLLKNNMHMGCIHYFFKYGGYILLAKTIAVWLTCINFYKLL